MGCGCGGGSKAGERYVVTLPDKKKLEVSSEMAARAEITKAGGGSYRRK
jgi:hypothetical protein